MRRLIVVLIVILCLSNTAFAYDLNKMSDDNKIVSALKVLEENNQTDALVRISNSRTKIMFYDLTLLSYSYAKHYAVSSTDEYGENYILINSNLYSSPKEALACLIAHESIHQLPQATYEEEVKATTVEAKTWQLLKNKVDVTYQNDILVKRLNNLIKMREDVITKAISNNTFYQSQLNFN